MITSLTQERIPSVRPDDRLYGVVEYHLVINGLRSILVHRLSDDCDTRRPLLYLLHSALGETPWKYEMTTG